MMLLFSRPFLGCEAEMKDDGIMHAAFAHMFFQDSFDFW
jgi:hypothetical protein